MEAFVRGNKIIFGMVGLPARGKTYIANKIVCYLKWLGFNARFFNIGKYRRENCGTTGCTSDFFDPDNSPAFEARQKSALLALADLTQFLRDGGDIAVYDGTNTTADRRKMVQTYLNREFGSQHTLVWIESICTDEKIIDHNILTTKLSSPDYLDIDPQIAVQDFKNRIEQYKKIYQEVSTELDGEDVSFIKLYNVKNKIVINQINGYIESRLVSFLMNLHLTPRCIYFVRHAESLFNLENRVGGDADLSERGYAYLPKLNDFFQEEVRQDRVSQKSKILTSTLRRAILTAKAIDIGAPQVSLKMLDELDAGICDSLDYKEVEEKFPEEWKARLSDKLKYRYPMGESYLDLILRVEPIIFAIERSQDPVIVVSHQAVIRCLYGYFTQVPVAEVPYLEIPLSSVIQLTPGAYKNIEQRHNLNLEDAKDKVQPKTSF